MSNEEKTEQEATQTFGDVCKLYNDSRTNATSLKEEYTKEIEGITKQMEVLMAQKQEVYVTKYKTQIEALELAQGKQKEAIIQLFPEDKKPVKFPFATVSLRTSKGVEVVDKNKLVATLTEKGSISDAIKTFDNVWLKKAIELGIIGEEAKISFKESVVLSQSAGDKS